MKSFKMPPDRFAAVPVPELFKRGLAYKNENKIWDMIRALHRRGSRDVLDIACKMLVSSNLQKRDMAGSVLGQLGYMKRSFPDECVLALLRQLKKEKSPTILYSIGMALGHLNDKRAVGPLSKFASHPDKDVRFAVAFGISSVETPLAVRTLITLSRDKVAQVRDWATFGLGEQQSADTPAIRKALKDRLSDKDFDTRLEAITGLANRKDPLAKNIIIKWLQTRKLVPRGIWESAEDLGLNPRKIQTLAGR